MKMASNRNYFLKPAFWVLEHVPCCEHILRCPSSPPRLHCRLPRVLSHHPPGCPARLLPKLLRLPVPPSSQHRFLPMAPLPPAPSLPVLSLASAAPSPSRPATEASTHRTLSQACPACLCFLFRSSPTSACPAVAMGSYLVLPPVHPPRGCQCGFVQTQMELTLASHPLPPSQRLAPW